MQDLSRSFDETALSRRRQREFYKFDSILQDPCAKPLALTLDFLKHITSDFSEEKVLGRGGFGDVYKGVLKHGKVVAVKRLKIRETTLGDVEYQKEVTNLSTSEHKNIVRLRGYCAHTSQVPWSEGREKSFILVEKRERLLCFEYAPNKSLRDHISDVSCRRLDWHMIYEIIRAICSGLHYLHTERGIVHMDLKPQNILLDQNMVPKIADFGMSRFFGENESRIITKQCLGTRGYMAPEYMNNGLISKKADMFSFGVIILELLTGCKGNYPNSNELFARYTKDVVAKWKNMLPNASYGQQVYTCISIGLDCINQNPKARPTTGYIMEKLNKVKNPTSSSWSRVRARIRKQISFLGSRICWSWSRVMMRIITILMVPIGIVAVVILILQNLSSQFVVTKQKTIKLVVNDDLFTIGFGVVVPVLGLFLKNSSSMVRNWMVPIGAAILLDPNNTWSWMALVLATLFAIFMHACYLEHLQEHLIYTIFMVAIGTVAAVVLIVQNLSSQCVVTTLKAVRLVVNNDLFAVGFGVVVPVLCLYLKDSSSLIRRWIVPIGAAVLLDPDNTWSWMALVLATLFAIFMHRGGAKQGGPAGATAPPKAADWHLIHMGGATLGPRRALASPWSRQISEEQNTSKLVNAYLHESLHPYKTIHLLFNN